MRTVFSFMTVSAIAFSLAAGAPPATTSKGDANKSAAPTGTVSPGAAPTGSASSGSMGGSGNMQGSVEAYKAQYRTVIEECLNKGNLAAADKIISKDLVDHDPGNMAGGLAGFKKFATAWRSAFPDGRVEIESIVAEGDRLIARTRSTGTHTGTFYGIAPTNKRFAVEGFDEVLFKNGMAVEHWGVSDQLGMMKQLGVMPNGAPQAQPSSAPAPAKPGAPATNKY